MISRNYSCLCWKDHIGQSFMHSQNRGCSVHTVRQSEPMDDAHPAVGTQDLNTSPRCEFRNSSIQRVLSKAAARIFGQTHTAWLSSGEIQVQPWALSSLFFFFPNLHFSCAYATRIWWRDKQKMIQHLSWYFWQERGWRGERQRERKGGWRKGGEENKRGGRNQEKKKESNQPAIQLQHLD